MPRTDATRARRIYRWLVRLIAPKRLRETAAEEMTELFMRLLAEAQVRGSPAALLAVWIRALADLLRTRLSRSAPPPSHAPDPTARRASSVLPDLRHALRALRRAPVFAITVVLVIGFGLAVLTGLYLIFDAVYSRPLPYERAEELVMIWETRPDSLEPTTADPVNVEDWRRLAKSFERIEAFNVWRPTIAGGDADPERALASLVTPGFFELLGVSPVLGSTFAGWHPDDGDVVLLAHSLFRERFDANPTIVGRTILVDERPHTVLGVLPPGYEHPEPTVTESTLLFKPLRFDLTSRGDRYVRALGRLAKGSSLAAARTEMREIASRLAGEHPDTNRGRTVVLRPLRDELLGKVEGIVAVMFVAGAFLVLVVCANLSSLALARNARRGSELAVRAALGAGRVRLARLLFLEVAVLSLAGTALGGLLVLALVRTVAAVAHRHLNPVAHIELGWPLLLFLLASGLAVTVLVSASSALSPPLASLRSGAAPRSASHWRTSLLAAEIALTVVLLLVGALLGRSLARLLATPTGMTNAESVLAIDIALPSTRYAASEAVLTFWSALLDRLDASPVVVASGLISDLPFTSENVSEEIWGPDTTAAREHPLEAELHLATPGLFETLGIPVLAGELPQPPGRQPETTSGKTLEWPLVVNRSLARRLWNDDAPIGRRLLVGTGSQPIPAAVAAVVGDILDDGFGSRPGPRFYIPHWVLPARTMTVVVRTHGEARASLGPVSTAIRSLDSRLPVSGARTLRELEAASVRTPRELLALTGMFAFSALCLAAIGTHGVLAGAVAARRRELGIRTALGASPVRILILVANLVATPIVLGCSGGILIAASVIRPLRPLLYQTELADPLPLAASLGLLLLALVAAALAPGLRALRTDPARTLQEL